MCCMYRVQNDRQFDLCSLKKDNVFSLVVLDGLCKYIDSLLHNGMDSTKLMVLLVDRKWEGKIF
jgi:hypothetical protein